MDQLNGHDGIEIDDTSAELAEHMENAARESVVYAGCLRIGNECRQQLEAFMIRRDNRFDPRSGR